jgi:hypothetical protein
MGIFNKQDIRLPSQPENPSASSCHNLSMATEIRDSKDLPEMNVTVPNRKPPVYSYPYQDCGQPDEADEFIAFIREMRQNSPALPQPSR